MGGGAVGGDGDAGGNGNGGVAGGRGSMQTHPVLEPCPQFPMPFMNQLAALTDMLHVEGGLS